MKVGDLVRLKRPAEKQEVGVVVSEIRHGFSSSFVDVLIEGQVVPVLWTSVEVISESR